MERWVLGGASEGDLRWPELSDVAGLGGHMGWTGVGQRTPALSCLLCDAKPAQTQWLGGTSLASADQSLIPSIMWPIKLPAEENS